MFGPQQPPTRKLPPPGASILFGKRFEEEEEDPTQPVQAQQPEPRMPPPGASILFGSRFAPPEEEMVAPAPLPQAPPPQAPPPQAPDGLKGIPMPHGGSDINPMSMMDLPPQAPQKPILPVSLASDGGSFENLAMMGMLPGAPLMDPNAQQPPSLQDVVAGPREMDNRWQGPPVPEEQTFKKPYADPISPSEMPVPMDQQRLGQPGSIGPSTPMDLQDAERAKAREEAFAEHGLADKFIGSALGRNVQMPIGLLTALNVKDMDEEEKRAATAYLDFDRGLAGTAGSLVGVIAPPVVEILFWKHTMKRLAPLALGWGATKLARALQIGGADPGKYLASKKYGQLLGSLAMEEIPFIAGDLLSNLDSGQVGTGIVFGLGAGLGVELVGAAMRSAHAAGTNIPPELLARHELRQAQLQAGDQMFGSELAGMLDAARPAGREVVSIDDLAPDAPAPRQDDWVEPEMTAAEARAEYNREAFGGTVDDIQGEDDLLLPPVKGIERDVAFTSLLEQGDVEDLEQLRILAITDEEAFRIRKRIGALQAGRSADEVDRIFGTHPGDPEAREPFSNTNVGEREFYGPAADPNRSPTLFHGARNAADDIDSYIDGDGNLVLRGSADPLGGLDGVSLTHRRDVAEDYATRSAEGIAAQRRQGSGLIFEIDRDALAGSDLMREAGDETRLRLESGGTVVIPKGKFRTHRPAGAEEEIRGLEDFTNRAQTEARAMSDEELASHYASELTASEGREARLENEEMSRVAPGLSTTLFEKFGHNPWQHFADEELYVRFRNKSREEIEAIFRRAPDEETYIFPPEGNADIVWQVLQSRARRQRPTAPVDQLQPIKQEVAAKRAQDRLDAERDIEEATEQAREQAQYSQPRGPRERPEPAERRSRPRTTQEERDRTAARLKKERERRQQAELSPVTGLPGRAIFDKAAARVAADPNQVVGLFDITNFKSINENLGWDEGDNILRRAAAAVQEAADEVGVSVRSRFHFGGDEFALTGDPALVAKAQERAKELFGVQKVGDFEVGFRHAQGGDFGQANKALDDVKAAETGAKFRNAKVEEPDRVELDRLDAERQSRSEAKPLWMKESEGLRSVGVTKPFGPETLDALNAAAKKGTFAEDVGQNLVDTFRDTRMSRRDVNDLGTELGIPDLAKKLIDNPEKATRELGNKWNDMFGKGQLDKPEPKGKVDVKDPDQVEEALRTNPKAAEELALDPEAGFLDLGTMVRDLSESRAGHAFRRWFYSAGDVDEVTFRQKMDSDSRFKGAIRATSRTMDKIQDLIAKEFDIKNMNITDQSLLDALNKHLSPSRERLSVTATLSDDLIMELRTLRGQIDALSTHLVTEGYVQGDLAATITNGIGTWLTRTYRQFDPAARATGWKHDPDAINGARNWAKRTLHADDEEATNFVNGLMSAGSFEDAWREITGRTMTMGPKQDRILQIRTGYVPQATRVKIEKHLTVNKKLSRNDVNDMVDAYIQRKPGDDRIIQELNKQANLLANDLDSLPIEKLDTPLARARSAQLDEIRRLSKELNERREIPEEIRALWGEESNPLVSALLSVHSAARQLEDYRLMKGMVEHGKEAGFVRSGSQEILDTDEWVRMTPEVQRRMGAPIRSSATEDLGQGAERQFADPFAGDLYIRKEFVEAFEHRFMAGSYETVSGFGKVVRGLTWLVKGNMTFRSLPTHGRNFLGASYFQVLNGHIGIHNVGRHMMGTASAEPGTLTHAFLAGREGLRSKVFGSSEEWAKLMDEYTSLGIVDSSVRSREFQENLKEILGGSGDITDWLRNREGKLAKIGATLAKVDQLGQDLYRMEDDIAKIFFFENERIALETHWANYVKRGNKEGLEVPSKQQMKQEAAWLSQDLYANYDRLPRAIQELRKNPLVGSFPSFSWEVLRTGKNHFMRMSYELNHPVLWPRGLARLMGGVQVMAAFPAMQAALRLKNNISKEEQDAFQRSRGTYQEDNMLLILKKNDDGTYNYVDLSYTDPGDTWRTAGIAYSRDRKANPGQMWKSLGTAAWAAGKPFNQAEIVMSLYTDITRNSDVFGRAISKEKGGRGPVAHSVRAVRPGTFRMVDRLWQAYTEQVQPNYTRLSKVGETIGAGGIRMEIGNPRADIYWKMGRWRGELIQTEGELNRKVESLNDDVTDRELLVTLQRLEDRRSNLFRQGGMSVQDARIMGIPDKDVAEMAKAMGLSKRDTKLVLANMYKPKVFGPTYKDQVIDASRKKAPGGTLGNEVARRIEDRVKLLRRASAAISSQVEYFK